MKTIQFQWTSSIEVPNAFDPQDMNQYETALHDAWHNLEIGESFLVNRNGLEHELRKKEARRKRRNNGNCNK